MDLNSRPVLVSVLIFEYPHVYTARDLISSDLIVAIDSAIPKRQ
jgi:hypothetical protein